MNPNPLLGVLFHWIGGLSSASFYVPYKRIRLWSWEVFWLTGGIFSWIIAPWIGGLLGTKHLLSVLGHTSPHILLGCMAFGALWGMGGLTFGLTMRYLGLSLGMAVALGLTTVIGEVGPPIFNGTFGAVVARPGSIYTFIGLGIVLVGIVVVALAGHRKQKELPGGTEGVAEFNLVKGILIAIFSGVMSSFFAFGLDYGTPISDASLKAGTNSLWTGLPVLCVVLIGGFATNFVWCLYLMIKNKSAGEWFGKVKAVTAEGAQSMTSHGEARAPLAANYFLAALGGTLWYFQFFFYTMGQNKMGQDYSFSNWTLHMASIILFSTLWGFALKEWKGTSFGTKLMVSLGIAALIGATVIIGYGNYVAVKVG